MVRAVRWNGALSSCRTARARLLRRRLCRRCSRRDWRVSRPASEVTMTEAAVLDSEPFQTTDGEIAIINLKSARERAWSRFHQDPQRRGAAEIVLEHEQLAAQFAGDMSALARMELLAEQLDQLDGASARTMLVQAQVASAAHRFSDARHYLAQASLGGAPAADVKRVMLSVNQACGRNLGAVL